MPQFPLIWRNWNEDETIVFHPGSGDTHLLNAVSAAILKATQAEPRTAVQIAELTAQQFGVTADEEYLARVHSLLAEFDELGLVQAVR